MALFSGWSLVGIDTWQKSREGRGEFRRCAWMEQRKVVA